MMERMCYFIARYLYIYTPSTATSTVFNMENYVYERAYMKASEQYQDTFLLRATLST